MELLPCPKCGWPAKTVGYYWEGLGKDRGPVDVRCTNPGKCEHAVVSTHIKEWQERLPATKEQ